MLKHNFLKAGCVNMNMALGNPRRNVETMLEILKEANSSITIFPELSVSGYSCGDLFFQSFLIREVYEAIQTLLDRNPSKGIVVIGAPVELDGSLYNAAIVIQQNKILGVVPKHILPNYKEFYEKRWFKSGLNTTANSININDAYVPFGNIIFRDTTRKINLGVEICEDMWGAITPGGYLSLSGANVLINLSASNETLGKSDRRAACVLDNSRRNVCAYLYTSAGVDESTSETVFSGHNIMAACGETIVDDESFAIGNHVTYGDIDIDKINYARGMATNLHVRVPDNYCAQTVFYSIEESDEYQFEQKIDTTPFIPKHNIEQAFRKIATIQEMSLYKRYKVTKLKTAVIGVSGGLDSTLALLVTINTFQRLSYDLKNIYAVTMPGLGTSDRTYQNSLALIKALGVTLVEKSIVESTHQHFDLLEHDRDVQDLTYENTQARIRTLILMNLANMHDGLVIGTGDLSEIALGWSTYNGDQMSMYNVNAGVPKTLVRFMVRAYAEHTFPAIKSILFDIIETPISPELLAGVQKTEDTVGKYEINDFILHRFLNCGDDETRITFMITRAFSISQKLAEEYVSKFFKRFYTQQFKRQASPDGPKILDFSLSPRSDFKMVSDIER